MALSDTAHEIYTACQLVPGEGILDAVGRIETILAEVRKQDTELIRQLMDALESVDNAMPFPVARRVLKVAHVRLEGKP